MIAFTALPERSIELVQSQQLLLCTTNKSEKKSEWGRTLKSSTLFFLLQQLQEET